LDIDKQIKKEKDAACPKIKEENFQSCKLEVNNCQSENANLSNTKEEGYRKRGRNWHGDNPEKIPHRYAYCESESPPLSQICYFTRYR
jgi:hypothetical protein